MRILVVGARGFVGVDLVHEMLRRGHEVVGLEVRGDHGRLAGVAHQIEWVNGDCADPEVILSAIGRKGVDAIYYGPYYRSPSRALNLSAEWAVMGTGSLNIFNLARVLDVKRILFPSSTAVHGCQPPEGQRVDEESYVKPNMLYGATKLACEHLATMVNEDLGRKIIASIRLPSIYGPGADIASRRVNVFPVKAARGEIGRVDYVPEAKVCIAHVQDAAIFLADLTEAKDIQHDVYELGGPTVTFGEIADIVRQRLPRAEFDFGRDTLSPLPYSVSCDRAASEFGLTHRAVSDGLNSIIDYELDRRRTAA